MAKKDGSGGGKKRKDAEVHLDGREVDTPGEVNGHALEERTEPPALPAVSVEPPALPPVTVAPAEPVEPPLAEVRTTPSPTPSPTPARAPAAAPTPALAPTPAPRPTRTPPLVPAAAPAVTPAGAGWSSTDLADAALVPLQLARSVLPTSRTSVVLGVVALGLVGVLDWPAAVGVGLGWEALRRWAPETPPTRGR